MTPNHWQVDDATITGLSDEALAELMDRALEYADSHDWTAILPSVDALASLDAADVYDRCQIETDHRDYDSGYIN